MVAMAGNEDGKHKQKDDEIFKYVESVVSCFPQQIPGIDALRHRSFCNTYQTAVGYVVSIGTGEPPVIPPSLRDDRQAVEYLRERSIIRFVVASGQHRVEGILHNITQSREQVLPDGFSDEDMEEAVRILYQAYESALPVRVTGRWTPYKNTRVFVLSSIDLDRSAIESFLTKDQVNEFLSLVEKKGVNVIDLMERELFKMFVAEQYLKRAILCWSLSPCSRQEQIHMAIISAQGQGKDYLIDKVVKPVARLGKVERPTEPSLKGAMSRDNLDTVVPGLLAKYSHARIVVSEVQEWPKELFGCLLGVMANGKYTISKGMVSNAEFAAITNILFLGNPPEDYDENVSDHRRPLHIFKPYTYQIVSRLTLIFTSLSLTRSSLSSDIIRRIYKNIDLDSALMEAYYLAPNASKRAILEAKGFSEKEIREILRLEMFQKFFREYLKYVSTLPVRTDPVMSSIERKIEKMSKIEGLDALLAPRKIIDIRKRIEFANLVKAFTKLKGRNEIRPSDIKDAEELFIAAARNTWETFGDIIAGGLDDVDMDIIDYVVKNPGEKESKVRKDVLSMGYTSAFVDESMQKLKREGRIEVIDGKVFSNETVNRNVAADEPASYEDVIRRALSNIFKKKGWGSDLVDRNVIVQTISFEENTMTPQDAESFVQVAVREGFLIESDGKFKLSFEPFDLPVGYSYEKDLEVLSEKLHGSEQDVLPKEQKESCPVTSSITNFSTSTNSEEESLAGRRFDDTSGEDEQRKEAMAVSMLVDKFSFRLGDARKLVAEFVLSSDCEYLSSLVPYENVKPAVDALEKMFDRKTGKWR